MALKAEKCWPLPASRWLETAILLCPGQGGRLAVRYKDHRRVPTVTCFYPGTTEDDFWLCVLGRGRYIHHVLPYRHPYAKVKFPCPAVSCQQFCGIQWPELLDVTVSLRTGGLDCLIDSFQMAYDADLDLWLSDQDIGPTCNGGTGVGQFEIQCNSVWPDVTCNFITPGAPVTAQEDPFLLVFEGEGTTTAPGTARFTCTEA